MKNSHPELVTAKIATKMDPPPHTPVHSEKIEEGGLAWVPASSTQLLFSIPSELTTAMSGKLAFLPVVVKRYEGEIGVYNLEWDHSVVIKCNASDATRRLDSYIRPEQLSLVESITEPSILDTLWERYRESEYITFAGKLNIFLNSGLLQNHVLRFRLLDILSDMRRDMFETGKSQTLVCRGCSGSGKTELIKNSIHILFQQDCNMDPNLIANSVASNLFLASQLSPRAKMMTAAVAVLNCMTSAPSFKNRHSTRYLNQFSISFNPATKQISSMEIVAHPVEPFHIGVKDPLARPYSIFAHLSAFLSSDESSNNSHHITASMRDALLADYDANTIQELSLSFANLAELLLDTGVITGELWESCISALVACLHLQGVAIVGADTAIISSGTKNSVAHVESALGVEAGSLTQLLLKKSEEKMGRVIVSDNKLADAKMIQETICAELYRRVLDLLLFLLSKETSVIDQRNSFNSSSASSFSSSSSMSNTVTMLDTPGWEMQDGLTTVHGYTTFMANYMEEKLSSLFVEQLFVHELKIYADESISVPDVVFPDYIPLMELFDKSPAGLFALLEETCQFPRGEDKTFSEKAISSHAKGRLIRNGGVKAKPTTFIVKHTFGDVSYDVTGFVQTNKAKLATTTNQWLASSPLACLTHEFHTPPSRSDDPKIKAEKAMTRKGFLGNRSKEKISQLLSLVGEAAHPTFLLCIRPDVDGAIGKFNPEFVSRQIHQLAITDVARFAHQGFIYHNTFSEAYNRYRVIAPLFDTTLPSNASGMNELSVITMVRKLMALVTTLLEGESISLTPEELPVFGPHKLFLRDKYFAQIEELRINSVKRLYKAASLLQACCRMKLAYSKYRLFKAGMLSLQSGIRMHSKRHLFLLQRKSANKIKATFLMQRCSKQYQLLRNAAVFIKDRLFSGLLARIRFIRLQRAIRRTQCLARGLVIRSLANTVQRSIQRLQRTSRRFLEKNALFYLRKNSSTLIQRVFRGWLFRERNAAIAYALQVRRNQRIVKRIVRILQSIWRRKLVQRRYVTVLLAAIVIQRWTKTRIQHNWYRCAQFIAQYMQKYTRKLIAINKVDKMRCVVMMLEEMKRLEKLRKQELTYLTQPQSHSQTTLLNTSNTANKNTLDAVTLSSGFVRIGQLRSKYSRRVVGFGVHFDISDAYPNGWLQTLTNFNSELKSERKAVKMIAVGSLHTVLVDDADNVYTLGIGDLGQLGHNTRKNEATPRKLECVQNWLNTAEEAFLLKSSVGITAIPRTIGQKIQVLKICCGRDHTLMLMESKRVYSWGSNRRGQLGHSSFSSSATPRTVTSAFNKNIVDIGCGSHFSVMLSSSGILYTWGAGYAIGRRNGSISSGSGVVPSTHADDEETSVENEDSCEAVGVDKAFDKRKVQQVVCGDSHVIVKAGNGLYCWGLNTYGQLGDGTTITRIEPKRIKLPFAYKEIDMEAALLASGSRHVVLVVRNDLYSWGWNQFGQVGNGTTVDVLTPTRIAFHKDIRADASLQSLETTPAATPTTVAVVGTIVEVRPGWNSTVVLTSNGQVFIWGCPSFLQTSDEAFSSRIASTISSKKANAGTSSILDQLAVQLHLSSARDDSTATTTAANRCFASPIQVDLPTNTIDNVYSIQSIFSNTLSVLAVDSITTKPQSQSLDSGKKALGSTASVTTTPKSPRNVYLSTKAVEVRKSPVEFRKKIIAAEKAEKAKIDLYNTQRSNTSTNQDAADSSNVTSANVHKATRNLREGELTSDGLLTLFCPFPQKKSSTNNVEFAMRRSLSPQRGSHTGQGGSPGELFKSGVGMPKAEKLVLQLSRTQRSSGDVVVIPALGIGVDIDSGAKNLKNDLANRAIKTSMDKRKGSVLMSGGRMGVSTSAGGTQGMTLEGSHSPMKRSVGPGSGGRRSSMPGINQQADSRRGIHNASLASTMSPRGAGGVMKKSSGMESPTTELDELDAAMESLRRDLDGRTTIISSSNNNNNRLSSKMTGSNTNNSHGHIHGHGHGNAGFGGAQPQEDEDGESRSVGGGGGGGGGSSSVTVTGEDGFDVHRVRDLAAMIQIIKKESLVQSASWKY